MKLTTGPPTPPTWLSRKPCPEPTKLVCDVRKPWAPPRVPPAAATSSQRCASTNSCTHRWKRADTCGCGCVALPPAAAAALDSAKKLLLRSPPASAAAAAAFSPPPSDASATALNCDARAPSGHDPVGGPAGNTPTMSAGSGGDAKTASATSRVRAAMAPVPYIEVTVPSESLSPPPPRPWPPSPPPPPPEETFSQRRMRSSAS
mmetsp:Transcript_5931/g.14656  ORF Transcript_5931/g.14656 Transcript_5931/m.14656 type:complete len:204 (-) Transcript_5931:89-700(-)